METREQRRNRVKEEREEWNAAIKRGEDPRPLPFLHVGHFLELTRKGGPGRGVNREMDAIKELPEEDRRVVMGNVEKIKMLLGETAHVLAKHDDILVRRGARPALETRFDPATIPRCACGRRLNEDGTCPDVKIHDEKDDDEE